MIYLLVTAVDGSMHYMFMELDTKLSDCITMPEGILSVEILGVDYSAE